MKASDITHEKILYVNRRVRHLDGTLGTVTERGYASVRVEWDEGTVTLYTTTTPAFVLEQVEIIDGE